ncbi:glycosyltransferase family 15 protein [Mycena filopes]|nr:glycosyltransferase family 15 protein [Mycena filopes]
MFTAIPGKRYVFAVSTLCLLWLFTAWYSPSFAPTPSPSALTRPHFTNTTALVEVPSKVSLGPEFDDAPYTASVVYLLTTIQSARPKGSIYRSLALLQKSIPWRYQWPILLFHANTYGTPDAQADFLLSVRNAAGQEGLSLEGTDQLLQRIQFITFEHKLPAEIPADLNRQEVKPVWSSLWPGYHHMCAFMSYKVFDHPRIRDLTYYWRLDDDSLLYKPACYDPIHYMHVKQLAFAFRGEGPDQAGVTAGMWPFINEYARRHPAVEARLRANRWPWAPRRLFPNYGNNTSFPAFGGNFEILKVARFRTPEVAQYLRELASDQAHFYWSRWSDAPVRKTTVYMFMNVTAEVHQMCEIDYIHKKSVHSVKCACEPLEE